MLCSGWEQRTPTTVCLASWGRKALPDGVAVVFNTIEIHIFRTDQSLSDQTSDLTFFARDRRVKHLSPHNALDRFRNSTVSGRQEVIVLMTPPPSHCSHYSNYQLKNSLLPQLLVVLSLSLPVSVVRSHSWIVFYLSFRAF
jgi:hypothetical protein